MKKRALGGLLLAVIASNSWAGAIYKGLIRPHFWYDSLYLTMMPGGETSGTPACTRVYYRLVAAPGSDAFKQTYAMLLASWMAQRPVELRGTGECTSEGDETIFAVYPIP